MQRLSEKAGILLGWAMGGLTGPVAWIRKARMFHPQGTAFAGQFEPHPELTGPVARFAERLSGPLLSRFSTAWWKKQREWKDAMGCAFRFGWKPQDGTGTYPQHQDLLFATIRLPITTPFAPITTNTHDFMRNHYFAVSPFDVDGVGRIKFRLVPKRSENSAGNPELPRARKLEDLVEQHEAIFELQIRTARLGSRWHPLGKISLQEKVEIDHSALKFSPFQAGQGVHPSGFVNHLRVGAYKASQKARTAREKSG